jgi:rhodanese-related sulfurtransferase
MPVTPITPADAKARLGAEDFVLLDCREPKEIAIARVPGAVEIPMMEIPQRVGELDRSKEIAVMCHHGMRSQQVAEYLAHLGFPRIDSVTGGIDAWSAQVDPKIAQY